MKLSIGLNGLNFPNRISGTSGRSFGRRSSTCLGPAGRDFSNVGFRSSARRKPAASPAHASAATIPDKLDRDMPEFLTHPTATTPTPRGAHNEERILLYLHCHAGQNRPMFIYRTHCSLLRDPRESYDVHCVGRIR